MQNLEPFFLPPLFFLWFLLQKNAWGTDFLVSNPVTNVQWPLVAFIIGGMVVFHVLKEVVCYLQDGRCGGY
jgi:hypothetical protein